MPAPTYRKKLIEVALPLEAINRESAREKSIRHGHPSTLHLWWARRPLAACRAVLFASLVDDPSSRPEEFPTEQAQDVERQRLFRIIEELVKWENSTNEAVLGVARSEIMRSTDGHPPPVLDPFCGGGSIPLEAQRLGLEAHGSDLNPVPVLITKALIEIPPKFAGRPPVNPEARASLGHSGRWRGATGLAEDVRYYGRWMRDEAERRIGHLYPTVRLPAAQGGGEATVVAWLWARTVTCPNPACGVQMPLVRSFALATKKGREAWVEPVVDRAQQPPAIRFEVRMGRGTPPAGTVTRTGARCVACGHLSTLPYVRTEAQVGRMSSRLMAIVAEGSRQRLYLSPCAEHEATAASAQPSWKPEIRIPAPNHDVDRLPMYGMYTWGDVFTPRQLTALVTFSELVSEARERVHADALAAGLGTDERRLAEGGTDAAAYADAVAMYLGMGVSKLADALTSLVRWKPSMDQAIATFGRQALPMVWDFAESNTFNGAAGDYRTTLTTIARALDGVPSRPLGVVDQRSAIIAGDPASPAL